MTACRRPAFSSIPPADGSRPSLPGNPRHSPTMFPDPRLRPVYIGSEIYRRSSYGPKHPLAVPRVSTCTDLIRAMGWLDNAAYVDAPLATDDQLLRFHDAVYLAALKRAEATQHVSAEARERYHIGADE